MSDLAITHKVEFTPKRCWECGRHWAIEKGFAFENLAKCPNCAGADIEKAEERAAAAERSMRAMRGAMARVKRGRSRR